MSHGPSEQLREKWRQTLARVPIPEHHRRSTRKEYVYTHGYEPPTGTWLVPLDWIPSRLELLGQIDWIEYISRKKFEGPRTFIFNHKHRSANRPWLASGRNKYGEIAYAILGGGYTVTAHGIEDDPSDNRSLDNKRVQIDLPDALTGMGKMFGFGYDRNRELDLSEAGLVLVYTREPQKPANLYVVPDAVPQ